MARSATVTVLAFCGELDVDGAPRALCAVEETLDAQGAVIIDLRPLRLIDAAGLRVLVTAHQRLGARLTLLAGSGIVAKVFELTGLDRSLPFADPGLGARRAGHPYPQSG